MKFVIHSPLGSGSAIGVAARLVAAELVSQQHDVTLVASDRATGAKLSGLPGASLLHWTDPSVHQSHIDADGVFYHVGNHYDNHAGALDWMSRWPGIVILHDYYLAHLFLGWAKDGREEEAKRICQIFSGLSFEEFVAMSHRRDFIERTRLRAPMTEWVAGMGVGAIVHSAWDVDRVLAWCAGPVKAVPLAYAPVAAASGSAPTSLSTLRVLTFGHINRNKLAHLILDAISLETDLAQTVEYRLVGPVDDEYRRELQIQASNSGVLLTIVGRVSDEELAEELASADIVCCLRMPVLESASASAIESLASGKPTIVIDTGFYAELPDDVVVKVDPTDVPGSLADGLSALGASGSLRRAIGDRGREYALGAFGPSKYAEAMKQIAWEAQVAAHAVNTVTRAADVLFDWAGQAPDGVLRRLLEPLAILSPALPPHRSRASPISQGTRA